MSNDGLEIFTEIGHGSIDFQSIISWGYKNGDEWYVVEQDECKGKPMESLKESLRNLKEYEEKIYSDFSEKY